MKKEEKTPKKLKENNTLLDSVKKTSKHKEIHEFDATLSENTKVMYDAYSNEVLSIGKDDKVAEYDQFSIFTDSNNWALWLALYSDSWVFRKAIDKPAQDVVNLGIRFINSKDDKLLGIQTHLRDLRFDLTQLLMWGALFGGAIAIMLFDNVELSELKNPLNKEKIKKSKKVRLFVMDRWSGVRARMIDLVTDTTSHDFLKPKYYDVTIGSESFEVHYSWILRFDNRVAPNLLKKGQLNGWGYAEGVHLITEIKRDEKLKHSISSLIDKSLIEVIKMSGMRGAFMGAEEGNSEQMKQRLEMVNWGRNYNSLTFLDINDEYTQNEFGGLSGLSDLMDKNMENIAAALDMSGVMFGDLSGGFSPDNYTLVRYDTTIRNRAESYYKPLLTKLIEVLGIMEGMEIKDRELDFEFETMIQINGDPLEKAQQYTDLFSKMIGDGYMSPKQAGEEMMGLSEKLGVGTSITNESLNEMEKEEDEIEENSQDFYEK